MLPLTPGSSSAEANNSFTLVCLYSGRVDRANSVGASTGCGPRPPPPPSPAGVARLGPEIAPSFEPGPFAPQVLPAPAKAGFGAPGAGPRPAPGTSSGAIFHWPDIRMAPFTPTPFGPQTSGRPR